MIKKPIEEMTRDDLATYARHLLSMIANLQAGARSATYEHAGCTASAMGWAIKYANIHELALRLVQAKGRFHTQKAFEDLREFVLPENADVDLPPRTSPQNKQDAYGG